MIRRVDEAEGRTTAIRTELAAQVALFATLQESYDKLEEHEKKMEGELEKMCDKVGAWGGGKYDGVG